MKKILFTDLDGTLLNDNKEVDGKNLDAISRLIASGHKFVISTGRPIQSAVKISEKYGWMGKGFYISSYNGGLIYDCFNHSSIVRYPIKKEYVRYIMDQAYKKGFHAHTYDSVYVVSERENEDLKYYSDAIKVDYVVVPDIMEYLKEDPIKVIVMCRESRERLMDFENSVKLYCDGKLATVFSSPVLLEFSNPMATKGLAVRHFCEHFNIPISCCVAVGDEENDISMITEAGTGIAMCNGTQTTKAAADYITENDNNSCGICEVIERFILN
ncbi:MAG: HAD family hydrolase [Lachnospiraceae bacterium]|nr:HAD family hydrolase [Lachnospiraceae bacterium]